MWSQCLKQTLIVGFIVFDDVSKFDYYHCEWSRLWILYACGNTLFYGCQVTRVDFLCVKSSAVGNVFNECGLNGFAQSLKRVWDDEVKSMAAGKCWPEIERSFPDLSVSKTVFKPNFSIKFDLFHFQSITSNLPATINPGYKIHLIFPSHQKLIIPPNNQTISQLAPPNYLRTTFKIHISITLKAWKTRKLFHNVQDDHRFSLKIIFC